MNATKGEKLAAVRDVSRRRSCCDDVRLRTGRVSLMTLCGRDWFML